MAWSTHLPALTRVPERQVALPPPPPPLAGAVQPHAGAQTPGAAQPAGAAGGPRLPARSPLHLQASVARTPYCQVSYLLYQLVGLGNRTHVMQLLALQGVRMVCPQGAEVSEMHFSKPVIPLH